MKTGLPELKKPLTREVADSYTLSSEYYLSAEVYTQEMEKIFYKSWQFVAHQSSFDKVGNYVTLKICDQNIFVIRSDDGNLRGFYNVCRHRAHELLQGTGNTNVAIVCPYHAWTYKVDGSLINARMSDSRPDFDKSKFGLREIRLEIFCGCVFINLDDHATSLNSMAGDLEQDILSRVPDLGVFQVCGNDMFGQTLNNAGWKVVVDNFIECYHCSNAHPDFASLIDMKAYELDVFDYWSRQVSPIIRNKNSAYDIADDAVHQDAVFWYLWPNMTFGYFPGDSNFGVYSIQPIDLESCSFTGQSLALDGKLNPNRAKYTSEILVPEDIALCESVQRGLKSRGYDQGPFMHDLRYQGISEHGLHHFHQLVLQALEK